MNKTTMKRLVLLAGILLTAIATQAQNLKKDSIKAQKIIRESLKGKTAPYMATITDKDKVAFLSGYIAAKAAERQKKYDDYNAAYENSLGIRYVKGNPGSFEQVLAILKGSDKEEISNLLDEIQPYDKHEVKLDPAVEQELLRLLQDRELEHKVIMFFGYRETKGWQEILENRLLSGKSSDENGIYAMLSDTGSQKAFDYFNKKYGGDPYKFIEKLPWSESTLADFLEKNPSVKPMILDNAYKLLEKQPFTQEDLVEDDIEEEEEVYEEEEDTYTLTPYDVKMEALNIVLDHGDERTIAAYTAYRQQMEKAMEGSDDISDLEDLDMVLVKYHTGQKKKDILMKLVKKQDNFMQVAKMVYADPMLVADADINAAIFTQYEKPRIINFDKELFVSYFHKTDEATFEKIVDTYVKAPFKRDLLKAQYAFSYQKLAETNKYLLDNGLVSSPITETELHGSPAEEWMVDGYNPIMTSLELSGISYDFYTESDAYPADYDYLLEQLAGLSKGKLNDYKAYLQYKLEEEDDYYNVTESYLLVSHKDKVYILMPDIEYSSSYDQELVQSLLDAMTVAAGCPERYILTGFDGQGGTYIFGEPGRVKKLAKDFKLNEDALSIGE